MEALLCVEFSPKHGPLKVIIPYLIFYIFLFQIIAMLYSRNQRGFGLDKRICGISIQIMCTFLGTRQKSHWLGALRGLKCTYKGRTSALLPRQVPHLPRSWSWCSIQAKSTRQLISYSVIIAGLWKSPLISGYYDHFCLNDDLNSWLLIWPEVIKRTCSPS